MKKTIELVNTLFIIDPSVRLLQATPAVFHRHLCLPPCLESDCPGDMAVRMCKVLARPWISVRVCHLLLLLFFVLVHQELLCSPILCGPSPEPIMARSKHISLRALSVSFRDFLRVLFGSLVFLLFGWLESLPYFGFGFTTLH